jgi:hypothetical protein
MKNLFPLLITSLFCILFKLNAQNLVSNPSFEIANRKPEKGEMVLLVRKTG